MTFTITFAVALVSLLFAVLFGWLGARPARPDRTRLAPWRFLMLLAFTALIAMAVHLVTLMHENAS